MSQIDERFVEIQKQLEMWKTEGVVLVEEEDVQPTIDVIDFALASLYLFKEAFDDGTSQAKSVEVRPDGEGGIVFDGDEEDGYRAYFYVSRDLNISYRLLRNGRIFVTESIKAPVDWREKLEKLNKGLEKTND